MSHSPNRMIVLEQELFNPAVVQQVFGDDPFDLVRADMLIDHLLGENLDHGPF